MTYVTRSVDRLRNDSAHGYGLLSGKEVEPQAGDVVLVRVGEVGPDQRLELPSGRLARLNGGDELVVAYGNGYATDQFEAEVPENLDTADLVTPGGVVGRVVSRHERALPPTRLYPVGLVADWTGVLTLARCSPYRVPSDGAARLARCPVTLVVTGTALCAGRSASVAALVRGLTGAGLDAVVGTVTGTGSGGRVGRYCDAGALRALDVTDFGFPSTCQLPDEQVLALFVAMHAELAGRRPQVIVLEVAGGLLQAESAKLVSDPEFAEYVDAIVFAAGETMSAVAGVAFLDEQRLPLEAVSGRLTDSPLAKRETEAMLDRKVLTLAQLADPSVAVSLLPRQAVVRAGVL
jgi:hypothetical protein